jgi:Bacterial extracellular solute-binding protein, family 7
VHSRSTACRLSALRLRRPMCAISAWPRPAAYDEPSYGTMIIDQFPGAQLGQEQQVLQKLRTGDIDFAITSTANSATVQPESGVFSIHFVFRSEDHLKKALADPADPMSLCLVSSHVSRRQRALSGSQDGDLRLWDLEAGTRHATLMFNFPVRPRREFSLGYARLSITYSQVRIAWGGQTSVFAVFFRRPAKTRPPTARDARAASALSQPLTGSRRPLSADLRRYYRNMRPCGGKPRRTWPTVSKWIGRPWPCWVPAWMSRSRRSNGFSLKTAVEPAAP